MDWLPISIHKRLFDFLPTLATFEATRMPLLPNCSRNGAWCDVLVTCCANWLGLVVAAFALGSPILLKKWPFYLLATVHAGETSRVPSASQCLFVLASQNLAALMTFCPELFPKTVFAKELVFSFMVAFFDRALASSALEAFVMPVRCFVGTRQKVLISDELAANITSFLFFHKK